MEAAALLVTHGASMEARDGQGRTALWHAVREEEDQIVEMLIHAGAKVFYENEDMACPTQLACKTALLKVKASDEFGYTEPEVGSGFSDPIPGNGISQKLGLMQDE